jgi:hypothetical protein
MGAVRFFSSSSYDSTPCKSVEIKSTYPNPDPNNYKVLRSYEFNNKLIVEIKYLDCTNYEGNKILFYENCTLLKLLKQKSIDPHFSENKKFFSPTARFEPTERGWCMAHKMMV